MDMMTLGAAMAYAKKAAEAAKPTAEELQTAVDNWLDDHPEATTTVEDGSITKAKLDSSVKDAIYGQEESAETTYVDGLNFAANATKYAASSSYETYYVPASKGDIVTFNITNTISSQLDLRYVCTDTIPAGNVAGTYIGAQIIAGKKSGTYTVAATVDGYVSISSWKNNMVVSATVINNGIPYRVNVLESQQAETESEISDLQSVSETVLGEAEAMTKTLVDGVNFAENAAKYTSSSNYETYYFPITNGNEYKLSITNTNANSWEIRYAVSGEIPADNIAGQYIGKTIAPQSDTPVMYSYTAKADGYFGVAYYKGASGRSFEVSEISGGIIQRLNADESSIEALESLGESVEEVNEKIALINGQTVELTAGIYWGATTIGSSQESGIQTSTNDLAKRTMLTLPKGKTLRIYGAGVTELTRLYWAFDAETGILLDIADQYDQLKPLVHYLRYDVETHIYINCLNAYEHSIAIIDGKEPWADIPEDRKLTGGTIAQLNDEDSIMHAIKSLRRTQYGASVRPTVLLHFSDIHGDKTNLQRLVDFTERGALKKTLDGIVCTGDVVKVTLDDGMEWFDAITGSEKIMLVVGNHDTAKVVNGSPDYSAATPQETYEALFQSRISGWSVTQPTGAAESYLGYYYKDYTLNKLRCIFLDVNHSTEYKEAELTWFESVLASAKESGLSVACFVHYMFPNSASTAVDCSFSPRKTPYEDGWTLPAVWVNAVEDFIDGGGDFVAWFAGHVHQDTVKLHNNGHQLSIGVSTAAHDDHNISFGDDLREFGTRSQDLFNVVGIDTIAKKISIIRVGCNINRLANSKRHLCIDYATRTVVWND